MTDFLVRRDSLETVQFTEGASGDEAQLAAGEVLLRIDGFSFTANNVSYATFGDLMSYWNFFPTEDGWGRIPVWGFAEVVASQCEGIEPGQRFYGYLPMSSYLVVTPGNVTASGFSDFAEHRKELHSVYNSYMLTSADPTYDAALEGEIMLLRPLFSTSFLIDDFFADNDWFGAKAVVLSSASSKTAYGTAFMLAERDDVNVIGLTAASNVDFVERLGLYDQVLSYDENGQLDADVPIAYIDFSGDGGIRAELHHHLGGALVYDCAVGATHVDALGGADGLPGPAPVLFFAPTQAKKRSDDWGSEGLIERISGSLADFIAFVADPANKLLTIKQSSGPEAVEQAYLDVLKGRAAPDAGSILSLPA